MVSSSTRSPFLRGAQARNTRFFLLSQRVRGAKDLCNPLLSLRFPARSCKATAAGCSEPRQRHEVPILAPVVAAPKECWRSGRIRRGSRMPCPRKFLVHVVVPLLLARTLTGAATAHGLDFIDELIAARHQCSSAEEPPPLPPGVSREDWARTEEILGSVWASGDGYGGAEVGVEFTYGEVTVKGVVRALAPRPRSPLHAPTLPKIFCVHRCSAAGQLLVHGRAASTFTSGPDKRSCVSQTNCLLRFGFRRRQADSADMSRPPSLSTPIDRQTGRGGVERRAARHRCPCS